MERSRRFVGQAEAGRGRRVWDKQQRRWWGPVYAGQPDEILRELNGAKRPVGAPGAGGRLRSAAGLRCCVVAGGSC